MLSVLLPAALCAQPAARPLGIGFVHMVASWACGRGLGVPMCMAFSAGPTVAHGLHCLVCSQLCVVCWLGSAASSYLRLVRAAVSTGFGRGRSPLQHGGSPHAPDFVFAPFDCLHLTHLFSELCPPWRLACWSAVVASACSSCRVQAAPLFILPQRLGSWWRARGARRSWG